MGTKPPIYGNLCRRQKSGNRRRNRCRALDAPYGRLESDVTEKRQNHRAYGDEEFFEHDRTLQHKSCTTREIVKPKSAAARTCRGTKTGLWQFAVCQCHNTRVTY